MITKIRRISNRSDQVPRCETLEVKISLLIGDSGILKFFLIPQRKLPKSYCIFQMVKLPLFHITKASAGSTVAAEPMYAFSQVLSNYWVFIVFVIEKIYVVRSCSHCIV